LRETIAPFKLGAMKLPPLTAIFEPGEDGWIVATCPELGIVSQGETMSAFAQGYGATGKTQRR